MMKYTISKEPLAPIWHPSFPTMKCSTNKYYFPPIPACVCVTIHWADIIPDFLGYVLLHKVLSNSHIPWPVWSLGWCHPRFPWLCTTSYSTAQMSHPMACVTTGLISSQISLAMYYFIQSSLIVTSHGLCDHGADVVLDFLGYVLLHTVLSNSHIPWPVWPLG
jgi:hypothetical protein